MRPDKRRTLDKANVVDAMLDQIERATQGQRPGEGRTSASRHQASVRPRQGALQRAGEEHGATTALRALRDLWMARCFS